MSAPSERPCSSDQRAGTGKRCRHLLRIRPAKMAEHAITKPNDGLALIRRLSLESQIALGVYAERPIVQICRADPQQNVVDDHGLGMDHDVRRSPACRNPR